MLIDNQIVETPVLNNNQTLLYHYIRGSYAHGTYIEGVSDIDTMYVYINSLDSFLKIREKSDEFLNDAKNDNVGYEIEKFMLLLLKSNPTVLESLFVDDDKVLYMHPIIKEIRDNRDKFLTKDCLLSFLGYGYSQIAKAKGYNKLCAYPEDMERKTPIDFCFTFNDYQGTETITQWLEERGLKQIYCGLNHLPNMERMYGVYYDWGQHIHMEYKTKENFANSYYYADDDSYFWSKINDFCLGICSGELYDRTKPKGYHGIVKEDGSSCDIHLDSILKGDKPICYLSYNKNGYESHCKQYKEWKHWKEVRNKTRYESNFGRGYDCYLESETEFLTTKGWKKYDNIKDDDVLITFNDKNELTYSNILDRFSDYYTGKLYTFENRYCRYTVTPNHKLWLGNIKYRKREHGATIIPYENAINVEWNLRRLNELGGYGKNYFYQLTNVINKNPDNQDYSDDFIKLLGCFLSEGSYFYRNNKIKCVNISQLEGNRLCEIVRSIKSIKINEYHYTKRGKGDEVTWSINDKAIINKLLESGGRYCTEKGVPNYVYSFSKRQFDLLFNAMMCGDGTVHKKKGHRVYYIYSKKMANDLYSLLIINGYNAQIYGGENGYHHNHKSNFNRKDGTINDSFHIFISKNTHQAYPIHSYRKTNNNWTIRDVFNERIVCFTTTTGTIITKNKNKAAFHGNSKNISECIRLLTMAQEIVDGKGFIVDRKNAGDSQYLLDIKQHKYTYEELLKVAEEKKTYIEEKMKTCNLPEHVDSEFVNSLLIKVRKEFYKLK